MLFRKKIDRACIYCAHGTPMEDGQILCARKGLRPPDAPCRRFRYDPCKRVPAKMKAKDFSQYDKEDFSL